jgi:lysophospholipid acyltransferase (LPLAT)-like uncharacterized protein
MAKTQQQRPMAAGDNSEAAEKFEYRFGDRVKFWLGSQLGYWAIRLIGSTLRWEVVGWENHHAIVGAGRKIIYTFWHGRIFMATYFWRNRGIVVMTSQNRDGEYIARVIRRFGYGAARGSSSRGGRRALVEMIQEMRRNRDVAFTIDGPRGPRYEAKPGAAWIAAKTGNAIFPFHISARKKWTLNSWDHFQIPKPFTRVLVLMAPPIYVAAESTQQQMDEAQRELQASLMDLLERGDRYWTSKAKK